MYIKTCEFKKKSKIFGMLQVILQLQRSKLCPVAADSMICRTVTILHDECALIQVFHIYTVLKTGITRMWSWCFGAWPR